MRCRAIRVPSVTDSRSLYGDALAPFLAETERLRPPGAEVIDAHTHLGLDEDGRSLELDQLLAQLDAAGARRACVFPLHDPERKPAYATPNDRVIAWAAESEGRLIPSAVWTQPKIRSARANAAWAPGRAASSCIPARRTSCSTARRCGPSSRSPKARGCRS